MNNPIRAFIQDNFEAKRLKKFSNLKKNKVILEIGCGNGNGAKLIQKYFSPKQIYGIDLDKKMIKLAKKYNKNATFSVGDASKLKFKANQFDAVFDFGILHHVPDWKKALRELKRVIKKGGQVILEDLSIETFNTPCGCLIKPFTEHPYKQMYKEKEFVDYLKKLGFKIKVYKSYKFPFRSFIIVAEN